MRAPVLPLLGVDILNVEFGVIALITLKRGFAWEKD
jgi:hypothetical protein